MRFRRNRIALVVTALLWLCSIRAQAQSDNIAAPEEYRVAAASIAQFIEREIQQKQIPGFSIAIVDENGVVWAQGFGFSDRDRMQPATAQTVYRVGSVSKLLSDVAVVQLIELGKLKLDDEIQTVLPDFHPHNPFGQPIKLRHLMNHQSGLVRESPVGNYFDPTAPSLEQTVLSLNDTTLVYAPGSKTKYSNSAVAGGSRSPRRGRRRCRRRRGCAAATRSAACGGERSRRRSSAGRWARR